ncbi:Polyketide synthase-like Pks10 [Mycobacterium basiliense]|uniref:Polyketide synthase-like Pks10 n=1 Tax=Mycobacterium basiliense TaxID=2094119 RepID=A0A3S5D041_9MYCO|nr:type III polyketide synthase [Mycobacterium basiliense]VDM90878.1 Polyketide synthase-like Pks10 [Mycobacterium basiliense]
MPLPHRVDANKKRPGINGGPQTASETFELDDGSGSLGPILCRPAVHLPECVITLDQTLQLAENLHWDHPQYDLAVQLISNTGVLTRHLVQPIDVTLEHPGFEARNAVYVREAKARIPDVVSAALTNAQVSVDRIDAIVFVSCTGFTMPSLTAWMVNNLGFRSDVCQIPIAQLGCAAGGAAINRAHDYCVAHPGANVLIVACEFCSLCYQPTDISVGNLLSNGLFGDAVAAAVVRGDDGGFGLRIEHSGSRLVPDTEDWISYAVKATGFHFLLDKRVPRTMEQLAPVLAEIAAQRGWDASNLDFYVIHAGGPRILDDLSKYLHVPASSFGHSRATLTECGNIASAVVLDALRRQFETGDLSEGARGIIAGFGPGITAEVAIGRWAGVRQKPIERPLSSNLETNLA